MSGGELSGYRVLVTRPTGKADELIAAIEGAGGEAIVFPVLRIAARPPEAVARDVAKLPKPDLLVFVSASAVECGLAAVSVSDARIVAVGPATRDALVARGRQVDIVPSGGYDSEHLLAHPGLRDVAGREILIVRGESGRELLGDTLALRGASVHYLAAYRGERNELPAATIQRVSRALRDGVIDCVTVMSVASFDYLLALLPPAAHEALRQTPLVAPGARVLKTAIERVPGLQAFEAKGPRAADMLQAIQCARRHGRNE